MVKLKSIIAICVLSITNSMALAQLPDHFDWRNVNGENWMTGVKNQGICGSCWAFAAVGTVEAQYNIFFDWPDKNPNLSEENLVSDCFSSWDCAGGWHHDSLTFIMNTGITDEGCFPYVDSTCPVECGCAHGCSNAECSDRCDKWETRLWKIDGRQSVSSSVEAIKNYLYEVGPLAIAMDWEQGYWDDDIWRCTNPNSYDHVVILVGWDEIDDYWIAKNSWGASWNGDGYFNIGYGECFVQNMAYGVTLTDPDTHKFYIKDSSGKTAAWFGDKGNLVLKGTFTSEGTCTAPSGSFIVKDSGGDTVAYIDSEGDMCIEGELHEEQEGTLTPPSGSFIVNGAGSVVGYINQSGDLYLKGKLYQDP